jgi:hypothetical protein
VCSVQFQKDAVHLPVNCGSSSSVHFGFCLFFNTSLQKKTKTPHFCNIIRLILPSSGLLGGVVWFDYDVSGLPIGPLFKGQTLQVVVNSLTLQSRTDKYSRNVGTKSPYTA